jgi:hypothetical protein
MWIWALFVLVFGMGLVFYWKRLPRFFFLAALVAAPFLGELIISLRRPIFYDRTLIWTTVPLLLLLAAGTVQFRYRLLIVGVVVTLGTYNLFSSADYYRYMQKEDWQGAAGYVANFAEQGDLVLFNAGWVQIPFDYYFKTYEQQYSIQLEKHGVPADMFERGILEPIMAESDIPRLLSLIAGRDRVWLVYSHDSYTDPKGLIPKMLNSKMNLLRQREYFGVQVKLYGAP